ncbi:MAG TPA: type II toxin-antitoxin system RelE/ParE family toxin [Pirellulales bacterium]|nr:type II toxin-antitoxin system RelE/ParE family toxin [Pirellulales bacterium]
MTYHVVVSENAKANLRSYYLRAAQNAPATADRWLNRFEEALATLASNPERCSFAPENGLVESEIRQLLFGKRPAVFRALFTVVEDQVQVLHIRRATMDTATPHELFE